MLQKLDFKNRIAYRFVTYTAIMIMVAFLGIYKTVQSIVYKDLNSNIETEVQNHLAQIVFEKEQYRLSDPTDWELSESNFYSPNPVFVVFLDKDFKTIIKSL